MASASAVGSCTGPQAMDCDFQHPPRPHLHHHHHHRTRYQLTNYSSLPYEINEPTALGFPPNNGQDSSNPVYVNEKLNSNYFNTSSVDSQLSYPSYGSYSLQSSASLDAGSQSMSNSKRQSSNVQSLNSDREDSPMIVGCVQQSPVASH